MSGDNTDRRLSRWQQAQVEEHLGLVGFQLGRQLGRPRGQARESELEDLFQEGCLGLIVAVRSYADRPGKSLAAHAVPRIHTAISRALRQGHDPVRQPLYRSRGDRQSRTTPLEFEPSNRAAEARHTRFDPGGLERADDDETIGELLRRQYVRAVYDAARKLRRSPSPRGDRSRLIRRIVRDRLLVPEPTERTSFRSVARATRSAIGRVFKCEQQLVALVRAALVADPETQALRQAARRHPAGLDAPVEEELRARLAQLRPAGQRHRPGRASQPRRLSRQRAEEQPGPDPDA